MTGMATTILRRVRWVPEVHPDEGIRSYLRRSAYENRLTSIDMLLGSAGIKADRKLLHDHLSDRELDDLSQILRLDLRTMHSILHRRSQRFPDVLEFQGCQFKECYLVPLRRRVSPASLARECYDWAIWEVHALPYCPESFELLISRCKSCGSQLFWRSSLPIELCQVCQADIREFKARSVPPRHRELATKAVELLARTKVEQQEAVLRFPPDLHHLTAIDIFELGIELGRVF